MLIIISKYKYIKAKIKFLKIFYTMITLETAIVCLVNSDLVISCEPK
jgi:hypothetical protein